MRVWRQVVKRRPGITARWVRQQAGGGRTGYNRVMSLAGFTHLRVHSHFSLLRATPEVTALAEQAAADGLTALALTDHDALYGAAAFARACRAVGIRPITGLTIHLAAGAGVLILLARQAQGYRSLCRLSAWLQGSPDREARLATGLPWDVLTAHSDGIIAIDGGRDGLLWPAWLRGDVTGARRAAERLRDLFGADAALGVAPEMVGASGLAALADGVGLPLVALSPVYILRAADRPILPLLEAIRSNTVLSDPSLRGETEEGGALPRHWLTPAEVAAAYAAWPQTLSNAGALAARCDYALPDGRTLWPRLALPADQTPPQALAEQAAVGLQQRYGAAAPTASAGRLQQELDAINSYGFAPLFLVVADLVRFARADDIPVSTRGSVANSLVAYCLGITDVDPLAHDLLFERFLNPARGALPDIDLDFCSRRRDRVLAYARERYGADHVALVAAVSTLKLRSAVREAAKAYGYDEAAIRALTRRLPRGWHPDPRRREVLTQAELLARFESGDQMVIGAAWSLVGLPDHLSVHPGGLVITPGPLTDVAPVQWAPKGFLITQFDHVDVEAIGLPKLDLLGIRALTVLADAAARIRRRHDPAFRLEAIPLDDPATGDLLQRGDGIGIFQCESAGAQRTLRQLQARTLRDLAVANAFFKPGPATGGMAAEFVRRYRGEAPVSYLHPSLEPILASTRGVLLFQEQILRVAREVAGLSWADADQLRRGMSKFEAARMEALQAHFVAGCQACSGLTARQAATLWRQVLAFAGYGFNQGHATAYAAVSYRSAYLKAHYPAIFMWARLAVGGGFHHPAIYLAEARRLGLVVRPPHVNHSGRRITLDRDEQRLWLGLGAVRDLRRTAIAALVAQRPFASLRDVLARVALQEKEVRHLIQAGALDGLGPSRAALLAEAESLQRAPSVRQMAFDLGQTAVAAESSAQRLAWELAVLDMGVSVWNEPWPAPPIPPFGKDAARSRPAAVTIQAIRLPGWTGDDGFFISDGRSLIPAQLGPHNNQGRPPAWQALWLRGQWRPAAWGGGNFVVLTYGPV